MRLLIEFIMGMRTNAFDRYRSVAQSRAAERKDVISDVINATLAAVSDPIFTITAVVSLVLIVSHLDDPKLGPLGAYITAYESNPYVKWALDNVQKIFGLLIVLPTCIRVKDKYRQVFALGVVSFLFMLPPLPLLTYSVLSCGLFYYISLRTAVGRIGSLMIIAWYLYPVLVNYAEVHRSVSPSAIIANVNSPVPTQSSSPSFAPPVSITGAKSFTPAPVPSN